MSENRYIDYDPFAWLYNKHWGNAFTPVALPVIDKLVLPRLSPGAKVLDLCCGTGQMAGILSKRGYRVTGIDGSENMLAYARENAPDVCFITADARSFSSDVAFDAVVCVFDSLNHIMSIDDLGCVFKSVAGAVKDKGVFLFDLNLEAEYNTQWNGFNGIIEDDHVCVIRISYSPENRTGTFDATLFRLEQEWRRSDFMLTQRWYPDNEVRYKLEEAGFKTVNAYSFTRENGLTGLTTDSRRAFFLCTK